MLTLRKKTVKKLSEAENMKHAKIQYITGLLTNNDKLNSILLTLPLSAFNVGKSIIIDGENITIDKNKYNCREIGNIFISTAGSMAIYDTYGKKLCSRSKLNTNSENIELFCVWVRQNNIPVKVRSGKPELVLQYAIITAVIALMAAIRIKIL